MSEEPKYLMRLFDNEQYAADFISKGHLYMNTLAYFRKLENDDFRGDKTEGSLHLGDSGASLKIFNDKETTNVVNLNVTNIFGDGLIYCFFAIYEDQLVVDKSNYHWKDESNNLPKCINEYHSEHGKTIIVLLNYLAIKNKIQCLLIEEPYNKFQYYFAKIEYGLSVPSDRIMGFLNRDVRETAFRKPDIFAYQQEYRLCIRAIPVENETHTDILLGDLRHDVLLVGEYKP